MSKNGGNVTITFSIQKVKSGMRKKGVIRAKILKKYVAEGRVRSISAMETKDGKFYLLMTDICDNEYYLTTYVKSGYRIFSKLDTFWNFCKTIGIDYADIFDSSHKPKLGDK